MAMRMLLWRSEAAACANGSKAEQLPVVSETAPCPWTFPRMFAQEVRVGFASPTHRLAWPHRKPAENVRVLYLVGSGACPAGARTVGAGGDASETADAIAAVGSIRGDASENALGIFAAIPCAFPPPTSNQSSCAMAMAGFRPSCRRVGERE